MRSKQIGLTLIEVMLAFAILVGITLVGIKWITSLQYQVHEQNLLGNVNQLFDAARLYYYANCRQQHSSTGLPLSGGALDPTVSDASGRLKIKTLVISSDLNTPGYITSGWQPNNPLVDSAAGNDKGYFVQFNRWPQNTSDQPMTVFACTGTGNPPSCSTTGGVTLNNVSTTTAVVHWLVQVAVKMPDGTSAAQMTQYKNDLGATCIASSVTLCENDPTTGVYLIWEQAVNQLNSNTSSNLWPSTSYLQAFTTQYTNDPLAAQAGTSNEVSATWYNPLNYLCGG